MVGLHPCVFVVGDGQHRVSRAARIGWQDATILAWTSGPQALGWRSLAGRFM